MPRLNLNEPQTQTTAPATDASPLSSLIPQFYQNKSQMNYYKGIADDQNKAIKQIMLEGKLDSFEAEGLVAKCTVSTRDEFDEVRLLDIVKKIVETDPEQAAKLIKTREYVDMDALENAIYNGVIVASDLLPAQASKEIVTLKVSKAKAAKAE